MPSVPHPQPRRAFLPASRRARGLVLSVVAAALSTGIGGAAHAQSVRPSPTVAVDSPAQPLAQALNALARQAGLELVVVPSLVAGRTAPAVIGTMTPRQALDRLLSGTGLGAAIEDGRIVVQAVNPAAAPTETGHMLPPVRVTGRQDSATTEGTGSYVAPEMSTATLLPLSARETPQSVTVITRQRIEDQNMIEASDALKYTPGITPYTWSGPNREAYFSRGFVIENFTYDGLPATTTTASSHSLLNDLVMYDRVEVVRGATGLSQGTGSPSATVNFVRKRPTRTFQASVEAMAGQWSYYGLTADVSGPLDQAGSLRGRAVVSASRADSFQDVVKEDRSVLYAIGEADLGARTTLTVALSHQRNNDISTWAGLPTARDGSSLDLPRSTFLGNDWNRWNTRNTSAYARVDHRLGNSWNVVGAINHIAADTSRCVTGIWMNGEGGFDLNANCGDDKLKRTSVDLRAQGPFELFGRQHDLVLGGAVREARESGAIAGYGALIVATDIDIRNWNHDAPEPVLGGRAPEGLIDYEYRGKARERGVYSAARFNLSDALKVIVGARVDWFDYRFRGDYYDSWSSFQWDGWDESYGYDRHVTKYAGVTYDLTKYTTLYASYTDVFQPQNARDINGKFIAPIVGKNHEIGVKSAFADGLLELDAAVFRIEQANIAQTDPACPPLPGCSRPSGLVRSQGFDVELIGRLTPSWEISAGYTYANPKTIRNPDDPGIEGQPIDTHMPRRLFKATTTYRLPGDRWRIGGSVRWQSDIHHQDDWDGYDYRTEQKAYAVVDAMIRYDFNRNFGVQLNVSNLFDKTYWRVINTQPVTWGGNALYGEPRRVMLNARYRF